MKQLKPPTSIKWRLFNNVSLITKSLMYILFSRICPFFSSLFQYKHWWILIEKMTILYLSIQNHHSRLIAINHIFCSTSPRKQLWLQFGVILKCNSEKQYSKDPTAVSHIYICYSITYNTKLCIQPKTN